MNAIMNYYAKINIYRTSEHLTPLSLSLSALSIPYNAFVIRRHLHRNVNKLKLLLML